MTPNNIASKPAADSSDCQVTEPSVPRLVALVYEAAPASERRLLLDQMLRPLGVLSLVGVAGGIFARMRFRGGWQGADFQLEDLRKVRPADVIALVDYTQQVSIEAIDGLARLIASSPVMLDSAGATMLVTILMRRSRRREGAAAASDDPPATSG